MFAAVLVILSACAPISIPPKGIPPSPETTRALALFEKAKELSKKQAYAEALAIYQDYLGRFPEGPLADTALIRAGLVHMAAENYIQARKTFRQLLSDHPKSAFAKDARYNIILTHYKEGDYDSTVQYARSALRVAQTSQQVFRIHTLMGNTYSATGEFRNAISHYMEAYELGSEKERTEIRSKVKEAIAYLEKPELNSLLQIYEDRVPGGYLRLQLAKEYALEDRIEPAMRLLSEFIALFPHHDDIELAKDFMQELESRAIVNPSLIGCILPLSGPYGTFGNNILTGIELALDLFNRQHNINPIQVLIKDSKGDPNKAVTSVEELVLKEGVVAIIGPMITSESAAIKAQALRVPIMTLSQKPNITGLGDFVFRNFLTPSLQIKAIVDYAVQDLGLEKFAILYPNEPYGISFMNRFWDELIRYDAEVVGIESYAPEQTDFSDEIKKLVGLYYPRPEEPPEEETGDEEEVMHIIYGFQEGENSRIGIEEGRGLFRHIAPDEVEPEEEPEEPQPIIDFEAVFIPDSFKKVALIAPQFSFHDVLDVVLLGSNLWHSNKLMQMARAHVQGAVVPEGFFVNSPSPKVQDFVKNYRKVFGKSPSFLEAQAYDAAWIVFQVVNQPHVRSRQTLKTALMEVADFPGVTGLTSFDETGDVEKELYLLTVEGRHFVQIKP